jgi:DNA-binding response OmpR family regulator
VSQSTDITGKPLVLLADDDATHRKVIQKVLEQSNYRVITAENGKEAIDQVAKYNPDVVLLDVETPELDGYSACKIIRARKTDREIPIFIITSRDDPESVERAYKMGATDFITKPIALPVLPHRINYILRTCTALNDSGPFPT